MNKSLIVVDLETGGTDPKHHSVTEVAMVHWTPENPVVKYKQWYVLEDPLCVSKSLIKSNNIDVSTCVNFEKLKKYGRSPKEVGSEIMHFLSNLDIGDSRVTLAGHNVGSFDIQFLQRLFNLADLGIQFPFSHRVVDTHSIAKFLQLKGFDMPDLITSDTLFKHFDIKIPDGERHTAAGDAIATAKLLTNLIKMEV